MIASCSGIHLSREDCSRIVTAPIDALHYPLNYTHPTDPLNLCT